VISTQGKTVLTQLKDEWFGMTTTMKKMLS
jgi:hypothetical protein